MMDTVLKVFADNFDVVSFLEKNTLSFDIEPYIKGEPDLLGSPNLESGFDAIISENPDNLDHIADIAKFIDDYTSLFDQLSALGVTCVLDIGYGVNPNNQFTQSLQLPIELMALCVIHKLSIEFSPYLEQEE